MNGDLSALTTGLIEIVWLDLLLAGDNAILLALATRALPQAQRRIGVNLGAILFMALRAAILFAALACAAVPGFGLFSGVALIFAAFLVARRGEARELEPSAPTRNLSAMLLGVLAVDAPVALLNMLAIQVAAAGHRPLAWLGLALAIPMLALGVAQFVAVLRRPPLLWAGAALLGWLAGQGIAADTLVGFTLMPLDLMRDFAPPTCAVLALLIVTIFIRRDRFQRLPEEDQ
jgi:predicted tellurium resistance membrane protein TerC